MMTGTKPSKWLREDGRDAPELQEEARRRKEISDSILEIIYSKLIGRGRSKTMIDDKGEDIL